MIKKPLLFLLASATSLLPISRAHADIGSDTVELLKLMYNDTRKDCGGASQPAFMCSGILLRATQPSTAYPFYSISPASSSRGSVSASYLRKDAKFQKMAFAMTSGFIFDQVLDNPEAHEDYKALCAFPLDGATDGRPTLAGCGDYVRSNAGDVKEDYCDRMGIFTAEQWVNRYFDANGGYKFEAGHYCAFDISPSNPKAAQAFYENIRAQGMVSGSQKFNGYMFQENEVLLAPWKVDAPRSPSITALFYIGQEGLPGALISQVQWFQATGQTLPAISMTLPQTAQEDVRFAYESGKQALYPTTEANACAKYVQSAKWIKRYDPGFKKDIMSLEIFPTACGRQTQPTQTNNFFNELVAAYYLNPEWINNPDNKATPISSMRRQLACVMSVARSKSSWMLEPARPYTSHEKSVAAGCNNISA